MADGTVKSSKSDGDAVWIAEQVSDSIQRAVERLLRPKIASRLNDAFQDSRAGLWFSDDANEWVVSVSVGDTFIDFSLERMFLELLTGDGGEIDVTPDRADALVALLDRVMAVIEKPENPDQETQG